jgi:hypothetical protein
VLQARPQRGLDSVSCNYRNNLDVEGLGSNTEADDLFLAPLSIAYSAND